MLSSKFRYIGIGIAVKDIKPYDYNLEIFLLEHMGDHSEVYTKDSKPIPNGPYKPIEATITARWMNSGSNRITPPTVYKGETVKVYQFGNEDKFVWDLYQYEPDIRGKEVIVTALSNVDRKKKSKFLSNLDKNNTYYFRMDTINKKVEMTLNKNDGEKKKWHFLLEMKKDLLTITNGEFILKLGQNKNYLKIKDIEFQTSNVLIKAKSKIVFDTPNFTIKGGSVKVDSSVKFNKSTNFNASVKMNCNASTTDGSKVK